VAGLQCGALKSEVGVRMVTKVLSGAQTGAARAALDWAIFHDIPHGGWCPKGRKAVDGTIPPHYQLTETPSAAYLQRTEWNVRDSDGTVIFTMAAKLAGGSKRAADFAKKHGKPLLHISYSGSYERLGELLAAFVRENSIKLLSVVGSQMERTPGVTAYLKQTPR
jgi:hypothetical protein